jgi:hypothetical protein
LKKETIAPLLLALALAACGDSSKIKDAVRERVKDPGSTQFKDLFVNEGKFACVVWNAKNSMGGYGDWHVAELRKLDDDWHVSNMEGFDECSEESVRIVAINNRETYVGAFLALQIAQNSSHFSAEEKQKFSAMKDFLVAAQKSNAAPDYFLNGSKQFHACANDIHKYATAHAQIEKSKAEGKKSDKWATQQSALQELKTRLEAGSCQ